MTRRRPSPSRSGGNRPPPPSSRPLSRPPPWAGSERRGPRPARGPRRPSLEPSRDARRCRYRAAVRDDERRRSSAPCCSTRSRRSRTRSSGRTTAPTTTRAGTACSTDPFPCPASGCTFVAAHMTAAHLVLVWEERDDPNLLWHAQRAMEVGRNPRVVTYRRSFGPSASYYAWEAAGQTGPRRPRQGLRRCPTTPGIAAARGRRSTSSALAWRRVSRRSSGALLAASGIAVGTAVLVGVLAGTKIAQDRSISQAVERVPAASRSVRAVWFGVPVGEARRIDVSTPRSARELAGIDLPGPTPIVLFRESTVAGHFVSLAGVEGLARYVRLSSGRLPTARAPRRAARCCGCAARARCRTRRGSGSSRSARARSARASSSGISSRPPTTPSTIVRSRRSCSRHPATTARRPPRSSSRRESRPSTRAPAVANTYRSYAWVWPLAAGQPRAVGDRPPRRRRASARAPRSPPASGGFSVQAPVEELRAMEHDATVAGRRLLLVGGEAAALLFAFAVLAARTMRRDLEAARRRLTWYGARRWHLRLLTVTESAARCARRHRRRLAHRPRRRGARGRAGPARRWARCCARASSRRPGSGSPRASSLLATIVVAAATVDAVRRPRPLRRARRRRSRGSRRRDRGSRRRRRRPSRGSTRARGRGLVLLLLPGPHRVRGGGRGGAAVRAARPRRGARPPPQRRSASRRRLARARPRRRGRHRRLPHARLRARAPGRGLPCDPRPRGGRPGLLRGPARHRRAGGPQVARPRARRRAARRATRRSRAAARRCRSCARAPARGARRASAGSPSSGCPRPRSRSCTAGGTASRTGRARRSSSAVTPPGGRRRSRASTSAPAGLRGRRRARVAPCRRSRRRTGRFTSLDLGALRPHAGTRFDRSVPARLRGGKLVALELVPPRLVDRGADAGRPLAGRLRLTGLAAAAWVGEGGVVARRRQDGVDLELPHLAAERRPRPRAAGDRRDARRPCS